MSVTVVIPTYNRAGYVGQAIDSVLQQSTAEEVEIIVVDDGSTDGTRDVVARYGNRVRYLRTENGGPARARNVGMRDARGDYIAWLDSDDLYHPYKIELQTRFLAAFPSVGLVCTDFSAFDQNGVFSERHLKSYHSAAYSKAHVTYGNIFATTTSLIEAGLQVAGVPDGHAYHGDIFGRYLQDTLVFTNSIMFVRAALDVVGYQDPSFGLYHDQEFVLRLCRHYEAGFIDVPTYKLRYHEGQISQTARESLSLIVEKQEQLLRIVEKHGRDNEEYYQQQKTSVDRRMSALHKAIALCQLGVANQPEEARRHLDGSRACGRPERLLRLISFLPYLVRRPALKLASYASSPRVH